MNRDQYPQGIGGWLLILMIWLGISLITGLGYNVYTIIISWGWDGIIPSISKWVAFFFLLWYAYFVWQFISFIRLKRSSIKGIKIVLILAPILNILYPLICGLIFSYFQPGVDIGKMIANIYTPESLYGYIGPVIISVVWYTYLLKSRRIANTYQ